MFRLQEEGFSHRRSRPFGSPPAFVISASVVDRILDERNETQIRQVGTSRDSVDLDGSHTGEPFTSTSENETGGNSPASR